MELTYQITKKDYLKIIEYTLREKGRQKKSRLWLFLVTGGQSLVVLAMLLFYPMTTSQKLLLAGASLLTTAANLLYSHAYHFKASYLLSGLLSAGQFSEDFWKEHTLTLDRDRLTLSYGREKYQYSRNQIAAVKSDQNFFYLLKDKSSILEAVPKSVLPAWPEDL